MAYPNTPKRFHKKKRIQKKFIKKYGYKSWLSLPNKDDIIRLGDTFYCYPHVYEKLKLSTKNGNT